MVEEWCGDSGGQLLPLLPLPLWDADAGGRRGAAQCRPRRAAPCASARSRPTWGCRASTAATGTRSSPACEETGTVVCMHIGSSSKMPATSADAPVAVAATLSFGNAMSSLTDYLFSGVLVRFPRLQPRLLRGTDRLAALHPRAGRRRLAGTPGLGRREGHRAGAARPPTSTARSMAASSATSTGSIRWASSARTASLSRPTIRTPTPPGPTPGRWRSRWCSTCATTTSTRIMRGNAIEMLGLDLA